MHVKTMEGLAGADTNMKLLQTPFRVYKDARRRGDTAVMERAMEYVGDFSDKTEEYQEIADKGMEEDARQAKEKAEADREAAIQKRREELEELEKKTGENRDENADSIEISEDGRVLLKENGGSDSTVLDVTASDTVSPEPVIYTKSAGAANKPEPGMHISVFV